MVMEADHRGRGPAPHHPSLQQQGGMPTPQQQQQNWLYQQQRQAALGGLPPMMMQPGAPFHGPYPMAMPGMPFQGPLLYHMGGPPPAPAHLMAMHPRPPHHPWALGQPYLQHPPHHVPQGSMPQAPRRLPRSAAPNPQPQHMRPAGIVVPAGVVVCGPAAGPAQARAGALSMQPLPAAMAALAAAAATAAAPANAAAASKSAARAVLVQPLNAATAQQAQAAAAAGGVKHFKKLETLAAEAQCQADYGSDDDSEYGDSAQSCETPRFDGGSGWAWLVDGVLQQVRVTVLGRVSPWAWAGAVGLL